MPLELTSAAFKDGGRIPVEHTADGRNVSPPLEWTDVPEGTAGFAVVCDDPDAPKGPFVHWVVFNIPAIARGLSAGASPCRELPPGALEGRNDFGESSWGGPSPPRGRPHRYVFRLYALDRLVAAAAGVTREGFLAAARGAVLEEARLTGLYGR